MMEYTDEQIREMAKEAGFLEAEVLYKGIVQKFHKFLELANTLRIQKRYKHQPDKHIGGKPLGEIECECFSPSYLISQCLNCGGRSRVRG